MSVLMHHRVPGMTPEQYDHVLADVGDAMAAAPGSSPITGCSTRMVC
jgi:hypothetical protein